MDYEKAYKEVRERAKDTVNEETFKYLFSVEEEDDDQRIGNAIIRLVSTMLTDSDVETEDVTKTEIYSWIVKKKNINEEAIKIDAYIKGFSEAINSEQRKTDKNWDATDEEYLNQLIKSVEYDMTHCSLFYQEICKEVVSWLKQIPLRIQNKE